MCELDDQRRVGPLHEAVQHAYYFTVFGQYLLRVKL